MFLILAELACSQLARAQSLAGAWVSGQVILLLVNFSINFDADKSYEVDCILGKAIGTYRIEEDKIIFTPTKSGINNARANDIGSINIYTYKFTSENTLTLSGGWVNVTLKRKEVSEGELRGQQQLFPQRR